MGDKVWLHGVHLHVVQLFDFLFQAPHVEILEAALLETQEKFGG
jgi:hypothetical protein